MYQDEAKTVHLHSSEVCKQQELTHKYRWPMSSDNFVSLYITKHQQVCKMQHLEPSRLLHWLHNPKFEYQWWGCSHCHNSLQWPFAMNSVLQKRKTNPSTKLQASINSTYDVRKRSITWDVRNRGAEGWLLLLNLNAPVAERPTSRQLQLVSVHCHW